MPSQAELFANLRAATATEDRRDLALALLERTSRRQYLDEGLRALQNENVRDSLDDSHRWLLREKYLRFHAKPQSDKAGLLREGLTQLLVHIGHAADADIFLLGLEAYYRQPVDDVAQNLRAAALAGLAPLDPPLACLYATRFLGEPHTSVFNCEPAMTALDVLVAADERLPIYQFLLRDGEMMAQTARGELTGKALESLGADFPPQLYASLIGQYQALDQPTASMGIISFVIESRLAAHYERLAGFILASRSVDLRRYGLIMLAAARDETLSEMLIGMASLARSDDLPLFIEALEICQHPRRDECLAALKRRL